jgi:outer membrane lipoprotein-sorting protein
MRDLFKLFLLFVLSIDLSAQSINKDELIKSIDSKYFSNSMTCDLKMNLYKDNKLMRDYKMAVVKSQNKLWMEFTEPAVEKGRRMLNDGTNLWMYLPRSRKLVRLPFKQAFMGSDASNRDILRISLVDDYNLESVDVTDSSLVLNLKAKDLEVSYNSMKLHVNKQTHALMRQELFALSGSKLKTIVYSDQTNISGVLFPLKATIIDELKSKAKTELIYSNVSFKMDKKDSFFTTTSLQN